MKSDGRYWKRGVAVVIVCTLVLPIIPGINAGPASRANASPVVSGPCPPDGATGVSVATTALSVTIEDPEGDTFDWYIETAPDVGSIGATGSNGTKSCPVSGLSYATTYTWYVNATDIGSGNRTRETYTFTTEPAPSQPPEIYNITSRPVPPPPGKTKK